MKKTKKKYCSKNVTIQPRAYALDVTKKNREDAK